MDNLRNFVVGTDTIVPLKNGDMVKYINFDNAATTPPFKSVMWNINYFAEYYSSIHRGEGYKSKVSTELYESARNIVLDFIGGDNENIVIFVKNTTEAVNKLAYKLFGFYGNQVILTTQMEHHSNLLPWRFRYNIDIVKTDECGRIDLNHLEKKLKCYGGAVKLLAITYASNVTGYINPIDEIACLCHRYNAKIFVDCSQIVAHQKIIMNPKDIEKNIDFIAFSAHKMYAPFGVGVLIGKKKYFESNAPDIKGGGTVKAVTEDLVIWDDAPYREEGGTPNLMGVIALTAAIETLNYIGFDNIENHENNLLKYTMESLKDIKDIKFYCGKENNRIAIIPFNIDGIEHYNIAKILAEEYGIGVRSGCFCAHPYVHKLLNLKKEDIKKILKNPDISKRPGMVRLSFGLYNTFEEIDILKNALLEITHNR